MRRRSSAERQITWRQKYSSTQRMHTISRSISGQSVSSCARWSSVARRSRPRCPSCLQVRQIVYVEYYLYWPSSGCVHGDESESSANYVLSTLALERSQHTYPPDPSQPPTLPQVVDYDWFIKGFVPGYIPTSAHNGSSRLGLRRRSSDAPLARFVAPRFSTMIR